MMKIATGDIGALVRRSLTDFLPVLCTAVLVTACSLDGMLGTDDLPKDVTDPAITQTPSGALAAYNGMLAQFRNVFGSASGNSSFVEVSGLLTDELEWGLAGAAETDNHPVDFRQVPEGEDNSRVVSLYSGLQRVRGLASQAIGLLTRFSPGSEALAGHAYTVQAYAEIFLAELFCSGIPLSTLDFDGDFTYKPGSTTDEVYHHALALLDTALTLTGDSLRFEYLVRIGKARALLALGRFDEAAEVVESVPDDFSYKVSYTSDGNNLRHIQFAQIRNLTPRWQLTVGDRKGVNGLDYVSSGDPRTQVTATWGTNRRGKTIYHPAKYNPDGSSPIELASGIEARLIEAEAALRAGAGTRWLDILNHLRRTMWTTIEPAVAGPLPDLTDPGDDAARVDLLMRERAFWLFLTGHRQGDLRRLVRHYGRTQDELYPIGPYEHPTTPGMSYGSDIDLPIPQAERISNPHFTGCIERA